VTPADHVPAPDTDTSTTRDRSRSFGGLAAVFCLALVALVFSVVGLLFDDGGGGAASAGAGDLATSVSLSEFAISPDPLRVAAGSTLEVVNDGTTPHNIAIREISSVAIPDLQAGESAMLDLSEVPPGVYTVVCTVAGHEAAGMSGQLQVVYDSGDEASTEQVAVDAEATDHSSHGGDGTDWDELDMAMMESMLAFPAETEGVGNQPLEFEVAEDGAKVFDLTAEIVQWEVEPGKFVDAWTYNGQVPGPWIDVEVGDVVRINVHNKLPMGTDVHWHGIDTPNDMDGVAPYSQDLIGAGEDFTYEFVAEETSIGMYHAHHHGQMQVPNGMFGAFTIGDVALPTGRTISGVEIPADIEIAHELPMVVNDAGVIGFSLNGKSFPATAPLVVQQGDWAVIHYYNEGLGAHPMHLHKFPQLIYAKDGIPLDQPYYADTINIAPGERYTVLVNFTDPGTWVWHCHILTHVESDQGMFGMATAVIVE